MAWVDDRIWCHPKFADISDRAFRVWVAGVAYSTGFGTRGVLTVGQQKQVGSNERVKRALVAAELWDELPDDAVLIHDWDVHNSKRDARREADRERKRAARAAAREQGQSAGTSAGQSAGQGAGASTLPARVEGSEGSDGSEGSEDKPRAVTELRPAAPAATDDTNGPRMDISEEAIVKVLKDIA